MCIWIRLYPKHLLAQQQLRSYSQVKPRVLQFKCIAHPKVKILSSFTHPHVFPNLYDIFFFCRTQKKPFWKMFQQFLLIYWKSAGSKTTLDPNDFYCMNLKKQTLKHFLKYILLCPQRMSIWWQNVHLCIFWSMFMHVWFTFSFLSVLLASLCIRWAPLMSQSLSALPWRMKKGHVILGNSLSIRAAASINCIPNETRSPPW